MAEHGLIVGSLPDCDVRVVSPTVSGRHCRLTKRGDDFLLEDLQSTNGTFVAGERIAGPRMVRRGDPVTLGQNTPLPWPQLPSYVTVGRAPGNEVVIPFETVSSTHARLERRGQDVYLVDLGSTNGTAINDPLNKITRAPLSRRDAVFLGTHRVAAAELLAALPEAQPLPSTMAERQRPEELSVAASGIPHQTIDAAAADEASLGSGRSWVIGGVLSMLVVVILFGGARLFRDRGEASGEMTEVAAVPAQVATPERADAPPASPQSPAAKPPADEAAPSDTHADMTSAPQPAKVAPSDDHPWAPAMEKLRKTVFLLAMEDPKKERTWPAASACAIDESTLLTSARLVTGLAGARQQGWTLWAVNEPLGIKVELDTLRVHVGYAQSAGKPEEQIFFDLGLVKVSTKLSWVAELASASDLAELEPGFPLGCVGVEYEEEPLYRFQSNAAELSPAKVLDIARLGPPPAPSLVIFGADLPSKQYGAAVVNKQGKVCAVFAEFAATEGDADRKMHYAPLIESKLILQGSAASRDLWTEPVLPEAEKKP